MSRSSLVLHESQSRYDSSAREKIGDVECEVFSEHGAFYSGQFAADSNVMRVQIQARVGATLRFNFYELKGRARLLDQASGQVKWFLRRAQRLLD